MKSTAIIKVVNSLEV